jgi:hypothetical protein
MNALHVGLNTHIELPKGGFLYIGDELPDIPRARIFDPLKHSFNPLKDITYKDARNLAGVLYTLYPQGDNTLTVRNGKRELLPLLMKSRRFDVIDTDDEEARGIISDLLASPVLKSVLCGVTSRFSFGANSLHSNTKILAHINRKELGDFDALAIGLFLINHFKGQLIVPDFGFYGRDQHISLIRENRLIAGVNFLGELPEKLRNAALLIKDKHVHGALYDDAEVLAKYRGLRPDHTREGNDYNRFIDAAIS